MYGECRHIYRPGLDEASEDPQTGEERNQIHVDDTLWRDDHSAGRMHGTGVGEPAEDLEFIAWRDRPWHTGYGEVSGVTDELPVHHRFVLRLNDDGVGFDHGPAYDDAVALIGLLIVHDVFCGGIPTSVRSWLEHSKPDTKCEDDDTESNYCAETGSPRGQHIHD
jgi:hypothetical protein